MLLTGKRISSYIILLASLIFFYLVLYRAQTLSMTHDEAGTYMFFHDVNFKDFFTEKSSWSSANNHLLNTLSYKIVVSIAGHSDLNIRLGNVLSFLIYLMSIFYIGKGYFKNYSSRMLLIHIC
jgi:hypothetical protein